ncbi:MAG: LacI family DNA-binding transcriptional regulator [Psychromonas sp.]
MATIRQVSEHAGVSAATVSRVMNGTSRVSHDKKIKVEKALKALGYRPQYMAKTSKRSRTGCIGIVVPELGGPFFSALLQTVEENLRRFGYHVVVTAGSNSEFSQRESIEYLLSRRVDALILHTQLISDDYLIELQGNGCPVVLVNRFIPEMADSCINIDNENGGKIATRHLLEMGHSKIACITGPLSNPDARGRLQGYRNALECADIDFTETLVCEGGFTQESGCLAMKKLLKRDQEFSAIFACNDHMAVGALEILRNEGIRVPDEISLIGFDNALFADYLSPALTTMQFPLEQMSAEAVQLILQKLNKNRCRVNFKLLPSLVVRESVHNLS